MLLTRLLRQMMSISDTYTSFHVITYFCVSQYIDVFASKTCHSIEGRDSRKVPGVICYQSLKHCVTLSQLQVIWCHKLFNVLPTSGFRQFLSKPLRNKVPSLIQSMRFHFTKPSPRDRRCFFTDTILCFFFLSSLAQKISLLV